MLKLGTHYAIILLEGTRRHKMLSLLVTLLVLGGALLIGYMFYLLQSTDSSVIKTSHHSVKLEPHKYNFKI